MLWWLVGLWLATRRRRHSRALRGPSLVAPAGAADRVDRQLTCRHPENSQVTSIPDITRMIARIEDWKGQGPVLGRAEAARRLDEARKLFDEIENMLADMRRELQGGGRQR